jgi:hypothetical protein
VLLLLLQDSFEELRLCDSCGRHSHFRSAQSQEEQQRPPVKLQLCSACKQRRYCSAECQKNHWMVHKKVCRALVAGTTPKPPPGVHPPAAVSVHAAVVQPASAPAAPAAASAAGSQQEVPSTGTSSGAAEEDYGSWGVRQLKEHLAAQGVDCRSCIEKQQLVELCRQHSRDG